MCSGSTQGVPEGSKVRSCPFQALPAHPVLGDLPRAALELAGLCSYRNPGSGNQAAFLAAFPSEMEWENESRSDPRDSPHDPGYFCPSWNSLTLTCGGDFQHHLSLGLRGRVLPLEYFRGRCLILREKHSIGISLGAAVSWLVLPP